MTESVRILAIDDDANILYTVQAVGESVGWHVDTAQDGNEGLVRLFEGGPYDIVLLDYHMPQPDGLDTVKMVRQRGLSLPIIVLTVDENQATADAFLSAGASDFALKPIKAPDLIARIRVHLELAKASLSLSLEAAEAGDTSADVAGADQGGASGASFAAAAGEASLPKGIHPTTLQRLVYTLQADNGYLTVDALADRSGLAYQTVCRYLAFIEDQGWVRVKFHYGSVGRPKKNVRWAKE